MTVDRISVMPVAIGSEVERGMQIANQKGVTVRKVVRDAG